MKICVGFSTTNTLPSKIIRLILGSDISHSYIKFYDDFLGISIVIHADFPGIIIQPTSKFDVENITVEEFEIYDVRLGDSIRKNMRLIGKKYDFIKLLSWAPFVLFRSWFKRKMRNPLDIPARMVCVDYTLHILNDANITVLPYNVLTPKELRTWCIENYERLGWKRIKKSVESKKNDPEIWSAT